MLVNIERADDPRLRDYTSLRETSLRHSLEAAEGIFIAEGEKVICRAFAAGYRPRSLLLAPRWLAGLETHLAMWPHVPVYVASEQLCEQVTGFHVHRGALGSFERRTRWSVEDLLKLRRLVVAEDIVDHTNVGALLRCAAGLGWDGALLAPRTADPLYRRSIKVSMGAVFSLPWARFERHADAVDRLKGAGFTTIALALRENSLALAELVGDPRVGPRAKVALLLGTEGTGLSQRWLAAADLVVTIPMHAGIDSLNVAAAAAVACYALNSANTS